MKRWLVGALLAAALLSGTQAPARGDCRHCIPHPCWSGDYPKPAMYGGFFAMNQGNPFAAYGWNPYAFPDRPYGFTPSGAAPGGGYGFPPNYAPGPDHGHGFGGYPPALVAPRPPSPLPQPLESLPRVDPGKKDAKRPG